MSRSKITEITSSTNPQMKIWRSLLSSKGIKKEGLFILSGEKLILEFLKNPKLEIDCELVTKNQTPLDHPHPKFLLSSELFQELDEVGTGFNLLVIKTPSIKTWDENSKAKMTLFLPLGDPANLGAAIRSAEAFLVEEIVLLQQAAHPFLPKAIKASGGSVLRANLFKGPSLQDLNPSLITLDQSGISLVDFQWPEQSRLLVGEEGPGLSNFQSKIKVTIPTQGVESLNATVALSIALYDWKIKGHRPKNRE